MIPPQVVCIDKLWRVAASLRQESMGISSGEAVIVREPLDRLIIRHWPYEIVALHDLAAGIGKEYLEYGPVDLSGGARPGKC
jgi:hypothetical protein